MKLMKIGPIVLLLVGLARCQQRVQGASQQASSAWSQSAQRNNQVYQSRDLATSNQPRNNNQQQQQHQVEAVEYYDDDEYYDDEPATSLKDEHQQREAKSRKTDKTSNGTIYEDAYYYDDDYEDENVSAAAPQKPIEPSTTTSTTTTTTTSEKPVVTTIKNEETTKIDVLPSSTSTTTTTTTTTEKAKIQEEDEEPSSILIGEAIVSVVTTKSVVNGTFSVPELTTLPPMEPTKDMSETNTSSTTTTSTTTEGTTTSTTTTTTTETAPSSTTIQASVQTGRSVSGARFLPFPSVVDKVEQLDSTESIIDKLDRVQSELSSGFLSNSRFVPRRYNKKPFSATSLTLPTTSTVAPTSSPIAPITITSITKRPRVQTTLDDIAAFLPKDFPKSSLFKTTTTTTTTTTSAPSTKRPKFQTTLDDVEAFLPKDFPKSSYRTSTTKRPKLQTTLDDLDGFLPKDYPKSGGYRSGSFKRPSYKTSTTVSSSTTTTTAKVAASTTEKSTASTKPKTLTTIEDISAFLPPGYKLKKEDATTEKSVLLSEILAKTSGKPKEGSTLSPSTTERAKSIQDLFAKSSLDISALLPPGYKAAETSSPKPSSTDKPAPNVPIQELFAKSSVDISALLPPGYKPAETKTNDDESTSTSSSSTTTEKTNGSFKVVFPSRPGGGTRKPIHKITTPSSRVGGGGGGAGGAVSEPAIKKGWPVRATTEFTGWPTSSTTPISIEKLLEAARTATVSSLNISVFPTTSEEITSTSSTTTTTTTTVRPTTPGICKEECEVAGTIKIVENAVWVPELLDRNTREWQDLAEEIEREMNLVFAKSQVLRKWFRNIRIDSFSQGSVLVDYVVELNDLKEKLSTQQLKLIFHDALRAESPDADEVDDMAKAPMKLGKFTIDPKSTDFVVIPRVAAPKMLEDENRLIPQWAIAVIVIGVGGLLFIIVFGVSVLVNRQHGSKLKPSISAMYDEEVSKHTMSHHNAPMATPPSRPPAVDYNQKQHHDNQAMWNDSGWHDKPFESTSHKILVDGLPYERKYNMYDSWKSGQLDEWNGYYHPPTQASGSNFSRHYPDYDINF